MSGGEKLTGRPVACAVSRLPSTHLAYVYRRMTGISIKRMRKYWQLSQCTMELLATQIHRSQAQSVPSNSSSVILQVHLRISPEYTAGRDLLQLSTCSQSTVSDISQVVGNQRTRRQKRASYRASSRADMRSFLCVHFLVNANRKEFSTKSPSNSVVAMKDGAVVEKEGPMDRGDRAETDPDPTKERHLRYFIHLCDKQHPRVNPPAFCLEITTIRLCTVTKYDIRLIP